MTKQVNNISFYDLFSKGSVFAREMNQDWFVWFMLNNYSILCIVDNVKVADKQKYTLNKLNSLFGEVAFFQYKTKTKSNTAYIFEIIMKGDKQLCDLINKLKPFHRKKIFT